MRQDQPCRILGVMTATGTSPKKTEGTKPEGIGKASTSRSDGPVVLVGIRHHAMRQLTCELLRRELGWAIEEVGAGEMLVDAIGRVGPEVIVVDAGDFPSCCQAALEAFPRDRVIVVGPEPDERYRTVALGQGAGSWVARDEVGDELVTVLRAMAGGPPRTDTKQRA